MVVGFIIIGEFEEFVKLRLVKEEFWEFRELFAELPAFERFWGTTAVDTAAVPTGWVGGCPGVGIGVAGGVWGREASSCTGGSSSIWVKTTSLKLQVVELKFVFLERATKFDEIFILLLSNRFVLLCFPLHFEFSVS